MRTPFVVVLSIALLTGGCSTLNPFAGSDAVEAETPPAPEPVDWMLIAPPDDEAVLIVMETLERMPADVDAMPQQPTNGVPHADWMASRQVVRQMVARPSAEASARFLAERSILDEAPRERWRRVRRFETKGKCEWTLNELRSITEEESAKITYRPGMRMADLKFLLLRSSWNRGDCVPADRAARAG